MKWGRKLSVLVAGAMTVGIFTVFGAVLPNTPAGATTPPCSNALLITAPFVNGTGGCWPEGATVQVTADDPGTTASPDFSGTVVVDSGSNPYGFAFSVAAYTLDPAYGVKAGDTVTATLVSDPSIAATTVVQPLSITNVDEAADTVSGTATPFASVFVIADVPGSARSVTADGSGAWTADFSVPDASGNSAYDLTDSTQIEAFVSQGDGQTGAAPPTPSTMITVTPSTGLVTGQTVTVEGSHWNAPDGGTVTFAECKQPSTDFLNECTPLAGDPGTISPDGTFTVPVTVQRDITPNVGPVDCSVDTCQILAVSFDAIDAPQIALAPISFETTPPSKNACKKGGWQHYTDDQGTPFKNQGDCVSFVATGGKNPADGGS